MSDCSCRHQPECHRPGWNIGCGGWTDSGDPCPCKWDGRSKSDRDLLKRAAEVLGDYTGNDECKYGMDGECDPHEPPCGYCAALSALSAIEARSLV